MEGIKYYLSPNFSVITKAEVISKENHKNGKNPSKEIKIKEKKVSVSEIKRFSFSPPTFLVFIFF